MKPPVYKTITTKDNVMLFVEESKTNWMQRYNEGDYIMTRDGDIKQIKKLTLTPDSEQCDQWTLVYTDGTKGHESTVMKIIAQPLESNLSGIPYYELTPQEEWSTQWEKDNAIHPQGINPHAYRLGFLADKAKGDFTEQNMYDAFNHGRAFQSAISNHAMMAAEGKMEVNRPMDAKQFISSLRQPMKIVSAEPIMRKTCSRTEWECNCGIDGSKCDSAIFVPATYTKLVNGKQETFLRLKITTKQD